MLGSLDIAFLGRLVTSQKQNDAGLASTHEVEPVPRPEIDPHLRDLATYRLPIAQVSHLGQANAGSDPHLQPSVGKMVKPSLEVLSLAYRMH